MAIVKPSPSPTTPEAGHPAPANSDVTLRPTWLMRLRLYQAKWDIFLANRHFNLIPSLLAAFGCMILLGLGTWQMMRLHEKNTQIHHITTQLQQGEVDLRLNPPTTEQAWQDLDYKAVILQGEWLDLHNLKILPRTYEGQNGYHLVTPFRLSNGQVILVNRGWAADKMEIGMQSQNGVVVVAGVMRSVPDAKPFGMAENTEAHVTRNEWAWPDTQAIAKTIGMSSIPAVVLYAERSRDPTQEHQYPIGGQVQLSIRNEHRNYALTWYMMALALLAVWLAAAQKKSSAEKTPDTHADDTKDTPHF
jgi:surfeit locus 1 family protein